jgi:hypothetical protein
MSRRNGLLAFFEYTAAGDYSLVVLDAHHPKQVVSTGWRYIGGLDWSPSGKELWFAGARTGADPAVQAVALNGRERTLLQITGLPILHDVGTDGSLLLASAVSRIGIRCLAPDTAKERELGWFDESSVKGISEDASTVLFMELSYGKGRSPAMYIRRTDGSPAVRLGYGTQAVLSPNGKWVACLQEDTGPSRLVVLPTGPGEAKILGLGGVRAETFQWFPDSNRILLIGNEAKQPPRTYVVGLSGDKPVPLTTAGVRAFRVSADAQSVVAVNAGTIEIRSLKTGDRTSLGPIESGDAVICWSADSRYVYIQHDTSEDRSAKILRIDVHSGKRDVWRELRPPDPGAVIFGQVCLTPDAKSYAFSYQRDLETLYWVQGVT